MKISSAERAYNTQRFVQLLAERNRSNIDKSEEEDYQLGLMHY